jgi:hypothetical protein
MTEPTRQPPVLRTPLPVPGGPEEELDDLDRALVAAILEAWAEEDRKQAAADPPAEP